MEICPTSNIQTNVFDKITDHPVNEIFNSGVSMNINTDGRTVTPVTLTSEYKLLANIFQWDLVHFRQCNLAAINHAFIPDKLKAELGRRILSAYDA